VLIVAGVDGSGHSQRALRLAAFEAALRNGVLRVVSAWEVPAAVYSGVWASGVDLSAMFREAAQDIAASAASEVERLQPGLVLETRVRDGQPAAVLVEEAADAAMLVVGSRGLGGFRSLLLGSVSEQVAHHATCPVLIVRQVAQAASPATAEEPHGVIVVGVDGSPQSRDALEFAVTEAALRGATLRVLCVWEALDTAPFEPQVGWLGSTESTDVGEPTAAQARRRSAEATLERLVSDVAAQAPSVHMEPRAVEGNAISVLIDESGRADLLVVGTRGRGPFTSVLLGSVSHACAHHAISPLAIVRSQPVSGRSGVAGTLTTGSGCRARITIPRSPTPRIQ
jgi:nucleotide-binding universal stress UspA family protein